ncbi:MAG: glycosyltransferase family 39 protein [Planctomycetes bacterium]|nr:glycosyltransferase family 39 protein [Planctomycetota bacterium]
MTVALCISAVATLPWIGSYGFLPEEARYAEIAREMLTSGDWLVPRLNGAPYFEKPPLLGWVGALLLQIAPGSPEFALRSVPAFCAFAGIASLVWFAFKTSGARVAAAAGIALAVAPFPMMFARVFATDGVFAAAMTAALAILFTCAICKEYNFARMAAAGAALAVAGLDRSPIVAFAIYVPLAVFAAYESARVGGGSDFGQLILRFAAIPCAIAAAIAAPWFILMQSREPEFFHQFVVVHHLGRVDAAEDEKMLHKEAFYFYAPILAAGACATTLWIFAAFAHASKRARAATPESRALRYSFAAAAWIFVLFTVLSGKRATYVLPAFPWLALMLGSAVEAARDRLRDSRIFAILAAPTAILISAGIIAFAWNANENARAIPVWLIAIIAAGELAALILTIVYCWKGRAPLGGFAGAAGIAIIYSLSMSQLDRIAPLSDVSVKAANFNIDFTTESIAGRELGLQLSKLARDGDLVAQHGRFRHAINFYCNRNMLLFGSLGELEPGYAAEKDNINIPRRYRLKDLPEFLNNEKRIVLIADWSDFFETPPPVDATHARKALAPNENSPVYVLARIGTLIIITNKE